MVHYLLLFVARRARDPLVEALEDYVARLGRYARVELRRIREGGARVEAARIARHLHEGVHLVVLDEGGEAPSTGELSLRVRRWGEEGRRVAIACGGADGLAPALVREAKWRWSLGPLTLPHRLAQVVAVEQLYRAHSILRGERYHRP